MSDLSGTWGEFCTCASCTNARLYANVLASNWTVTGSTITSLDPYVWTTTGSTIATSPTYEIRFVPPDPPSPETVAVIRQGYLRRMFERWVDDARRRWEAYDADRLYEEGEARAEALLREALTEEQLDDFDVNGWFLVGTADGVYRIERGYSGNVRLLRGYSAEGHGPGAAFCIHPIGNPFDADVMLAQKFLLENDEREFLRIANRA